MKRLLILLLAVLFLFSSFPILATAKANEYNELNLQSADIQLIEFEYTSGTIAQESTTAEIYKTDKFVFSTKNPSEIEYITHYLNSLDIVDDGNVVSISDGTYLDFSLTKKDGSKEYMGFMGFKRLYLTDNLDNVDNQYSVNKVNEYRRFLEFIYALKTDKSILDENITYVPSEWAKEYVNTAVENGLVPKWNQINYVGNINRVEVCQLIDNLLKNKGVETEVNVENPFKDTTDESVLSLYDKDIINGKSYTKFYPYDYITREEFAKILSGTYLFLNKKKSVVNDSLEFVDKDDISDWATEFVEHINTSDLMIGNENNEFKPKDNITKEEVIVTLLRLTDKITVTPDVPIAEDGSNLFAFRKEGLYGYMDINGKIKIKPQYYSAGDFHEGLAVVSKYDFDKKIITSGVIDIYGNAVVPFDAISITGYFSEGFAVAYDEPYVNAEELAEHELSEHDWIIEITSEPLSDYYFIDRKGNKVFDKTFPVAYTFSSGHALVDISEGFICGVSLYADSQEITPGYAYIDETGEYVTDEKFYNAFFFIGDYAIVLRNDEFEVVNTSLETVLKLNGYDAFWLSEDGYLEVEKDGKYGVINLKNEVVIPFEYDALGTIFPEFFGFSEGLCPAQKDGKWGYIDINNNVIIPFEYAHAGEFINDLAIVKLENKKEGLINKKGELVFETEESIWTSSENGMYCVGTPYKSELDFDSITVSSEIGGLQTIRVHNKPKSVPKDLTYLNKNLEIVVPH